MTKKKPSQNSATIEAKSVVTVSSLRANVYQLLDEVIERNAPLQVMRKGQLLRIEPPTKPCSRMASLPKRECIVGNAEALVHCDWSKLWRSKIDPA